MSNDRKMKTLFIVITALFLANSALAKSLKLEDFFGGDEIQLFDLCSIINQVYLDKAVTDNNLGLVRKYIIHKTTYETNSMYTLASQNRLNLEKVSERALYVGNTIKGAIEKGFYSLEEVVQMEPQCVERYFLRTFPIEVQIDGLSRTAFQTIVNQNWLKFYGLISD